MDSKKSPIDSKDSKGASTRHTILTQAVGLASRLGLEGVSLGGLASELSLSKSGLFAHFRSKETLQRDILKKAAEDFTQHVIRPAVQAPRGEARVRALFDSWLGWAKSHASSGGCFFVAASVELDDRPGKLRDELLQSQLAWKDTRVRVLQTAVESGEFRKDLDLDQAAHDLYSLMLGYHYAWRLLRDPKAEKKVRLAFENFLRACR